MSVVGQSRPNWAVRGHVRFPPDSDQTADVAGGPFRANTRHCGRGRGRHVREVASRHRQPSLRSHGLNRVCRSCDMGVVEHHSSYSEQNSNLENENSNDTRPENVGAFFVHFFERRWHRCLLRGFVPTWVAPMLMCECEPVHLSQERSKPRRRFRSITPPVPRGKLVGKLFVGSR
jgi:hypothetical protein